MNVFEHDKLSKFTKIHIKVTEEPFYCCSTFHGYNSVFNNKVTTGSSVIRSVFHNLYKKNIWKLGLQTILWHAKFNSTSGPIISRMRIHMNIKLSLMWTQMSIILSWMWTHMSIILSSSFQCPAYKSTFQITLCRADLNKNKKLMQRCVSGVVYQ